jgi:tetrahedral aminopeptidase
MNSPLALRVHRLSAVWGPAGREQNIARVLADAISPYVDEVHTDRFGNVVAIKKGTGKRVMVTAHMDTIGAVALNISDNGLISMAPVGGFKAHHAIGQKVVWGSGVVGVLQHQHAEEAKEVAFGKLFCDIGANSREEALENVRLGDMCTLVGEVQQLGETLVGPGLDNRAGCAVVLQVAEHLGKTEHEVAFVFTCQGEIGPRGAGAAAFGVAPDLAIVVDVTTAGDYPKAPRVDVKLGGGPALKLKDGNYMAHYGMSERVRKVADDHAIPLQTEIVAAGSHNDAQVVSVAGQGVPTAVIDIPARYRGTGGEMVNMRDLHGAADLVLKLLEHKLDLQ